jgi:dipeptidyl aminopeptidase/acylaminoacyl peptidase
LSNGSCHRSSGEKTHKGSRRNLLGPAPTAAQIERFSNEIRVTRETPPTFLAHALDDRVVVPANSRMFYDALRAHGVPAEYLELPNGGHGLDGYQGPNWDAWQTKALQWFVAIGVFPQD